MSAAHAPFFTSLLAGQPMLRSTPAKLTSSGRSSSRANVPSAICSHTARKFSGCSPHSWAMTLPSWATKRSFLSKFTRPGLISPSTFTNSVKNRSGGAQSATVCRNTVSVTSSIGAKIKIGPCEVGDVSVIAILYLEIIVSFQSAHPKIDTSLDQATHKAIG